jgi:hypothetical protein
VVVQIAVSIKRLEFLHHEVLHHCCVIDLCLFCCCGTGLPGWYALILLRFNKRLADGCTDKCFPILKLNKPLAKIATTICQNLLHTTPPATAIKTVTTTVVTTSTPNAPINTVTAIASITVNDLILCSTTVTQQRALTTSYGFNQQHVIKRRQGEKQQEA